MQKQVQRSEGILVVFHMRINEKSVFSASKFSLY